jgi:hypothetical protein
MAIAYRIYSNAGNGGPVDYTTPVATTSGLSYTTGAVAPATDTTFAVRAYDTVTNLEEANTDAQVRVVIGANGADQGLSPNAAQAVTLTPSAGGGCRVGWSYAPDDTWGAPAGFHVYLGSGQGGGSGSLSATVAYTPGQIGYSVVISGPLTRTSYTATVGVYNGSGETASAPSTPVVVGAPFQDFDMSPIQITLL